MALDEVHEQNNAVIKSCAGATNFVNKSDESALIRCETCCPDIARMTTEFEESMENEFHSQQQQKHHEENDSFRAKFTQDIKTLCSNDNCTIAVRAFTSVSEMQDADENQFTTFQEDRLIYQKLSTCETIPKNNFNV